MPNLGRLAAGGEQAALVASFPCVTCPVQATMMTGATPPEHGVVANGFFWRRAEVAVEMWTAWNECIQRPQIWDGCTSIDPGLDLGRVVSAAQQRCGADLICT